jgi:hypothetical protein
LDGAVIQNMTLGAPLLTFNPPTETIAGITRFHRHISNARSNSASM